METGYSQTNIALQGVALSLILTATSYHILSLMPFLFSFEVKFLDQDLEGLWESQSSLKSPLLPH